MATVQVVSNGNEVPTTVQIRPALFFVIEGYGCGEPEDAEFQGVQAIEEIEE